MACWSAARRVADLCAMGAARQAAPCRRLHLIRAFHFPPPQLITPLKRSLSSTSCSLAASSSSDKGFGFPRPEEVSWTSGLSNSVRLIGRISNTVSITYLDSGKIVTETSLRVQRGNSSRFSEFVLQFWDELAEVAAAHLKKEDCVFVFGSLWVENFVTKGSEQKSICKVLCKDLKFVSGISEPSNVSENIETGMEAKEASVNEDLWRDYFQNPMDFWDNRLSKKGPKSPDFKHKKSDSALWISNTNTPSWVHEKLAQAPPILTEKGETGKEIKQSWQEFFADPSEWWDNRKSKKNPRYPDFKCKSTGDALWIDSTSTPSWVKSQLELLDSKTSSRDGSADWASGSQKASMSSVEDDLMYF